VVFSADGGSSTEKTSTVTFVASTKVASTAMLASAAPTAWMPLLVSLWATGVGLFSFRSAGGLMLAYLRAKRAQMTLPSEFHQAAQRLAARLGLRRVVQLRASLNGIAPSVVGWVKPVLVVPAAALRLPLEQLEALLAHELAHIRRHDFLVNLLQNAVETLLFYHPAVWWLGRKIREERENCCDDLAVAVCGDRLLYAQALTSLEELRSQVPDFAMAATGGSLVKRIARLLGKGEPAVHGSSIWLLTAIAVCGIAVLIGTAVQAEQGVTIPEAEAPAALAAVAASPERSPVEPTATQQPGNQPGQPAPTQSQATPAPATSSPSTPNYIAEITAAGYSNLSIDDLISFKIHGVTGDYIRSVRAMGFTPDSEQVVSMKIHGVTPEYAEALKSSGLNNLSIDDLISGRIHGVTPDSVKQLQAAGVPAASFDDLISARIHGVNADFVREMHSAGFSSLTFDDLVSARVHGLESSTIRELRNLGLGNLTFDELISAQVHGINSDFVRKAQQAGLKNLTLDKIIQLKIHQILD
jgi:beta-lactamase regulating signal transducer with metallopeptidase domain